MDTLNDVIECLMEQNNKQQHDILNNETYSRRNYLLFRGFDSTEDPCDVIVRRIILKTGIQGVERIQFVWCHYLEGRKQIIARFQSYADRDGVWKNCFNLKSTLHNQCYVSEDFPASIVSDRIQLYLVFKAAKILPEFHRKVTIIDNRLKLNDKFYSTDSLHTVPKPLNPAFLAERVPNEVYVFGGSTSRYCKHSNFLNRNFVYNNIMYTSTQQAFQHMKTREAKDLNKCREIIFNVDPRTHKFLSQRVSGLNEDEWNKIKLSCMKNILLTKCTQHQDLREALMNTCDQTITEAHGRDYVFAIGLPITHKDVMNPNAWRGKNHFGKLLMEVRQELSH